MAGHDPAPAIIAGNLSGSPHRPTLMTTSRSNRIVVLAAALLALASGLAGCSSGTPVPSPTTSPAPSTVASPVASPEAGVLLVVETRGGLCAPGPCGRTIVVDRVGRVHQAAKPPNDLGVVPAIALAALNDAIWTTNFAELASHRFTGVCPTAYDGQEVVFEFATRTGIQRIATCEVEVDFNSPLFVAVSAAVGEFVSLPTPQ